MEYEIHIGEVVDFGNGEKRAKQVFVITKEQLDIIETFANIKKDSDLNTVYVLNDCHFKVFPRFGIINMKTNQEVTL